MSKCRLPFFGTGSLFCARDSTSALAPGAGISHVEIRTIDNRAAGLYSGDLALGLQLYTCVP